MSTLSLAPPRPTVWTVPTFHRVRESGVWDGRRPILLQGTVWELGPMNPPHAVSVNLVFQALQPIFGAGWVIRPQLPLVLDLDTDPLPDIAVVTGSPRDYLHDHPKTAALVVEISDTTLGLDITEKAELYATADIRDYWVLDLNAQRLLVFRDPAALPDGGASYRSHLTLGPAESISPLAAPSATVRVADLLP